MTVDSPIAVEADGVELIGYCDLAGRPALKMALHEQDGRRFMYLGSLFHPGWSIVDVTDPTAPTLLRFLDGPPNTWTLQVQAAGGQLMTGLEVPRPGWTDSTEGAEEGVILWDLTADPTDPKPLGRFATGDLGTHRNYFDGGPVAVLSASMPGYVHRLPVFVDVSDPTAPREIARWWWPGQHVAGGEEPEHDVYLHGPAYIRGDRAYLGYGRVGMVVLDVSRPERPEMVARVDFGDLGSARPGCHSAVPVPGTDLIVVNSEAHQDNPGDVDSLNYTFVIRERGDDYTILSAFPMPAPKPGLPYRNYYDKGGRFGPHNQHHHQGHPLHASPSDLIYMTYFNAGLRVFDIGDPMMPTEVAHYVPDDPPVRRGPKPKVLVTQFEDVLVDDRGFVFCTDKNRGLFVFRLTLGASDGAAR